MRLTDMAAAGVSLMALATFGGVAATGWTFFNLMMWCSGIFSVGGAALVVYGLRRADKILGGRDPNLILLKMDKALDDIDAFLGNPGVQSFLSSLVVPVEENKGGILDGDAGRA